VRTLWRKTLFTQRKRKRQRRISELLFLWKKRHMYWESLDRKNVGVRGAHIFE